MTISKQMLGLAQETCGNLRGLDRLLAIAINEINAKVFEEDKNASDAADASGHSNNAAISTANF